MAMAANDRICFTKIVKKAHMAEMPIPKPVYEKYSIGPLRGTVILELGGSGWQVEVGGSGSFTTGWKQFCLDNGIKENDSLVFHHEMGRRFSVELYSSDGSAKQGGAPKSSSSRGAVAEAIEKVIKECVVHLDEDSSLKFVISKVPRVVDPDVAEPSTPGKIKAVGNGPWSRTRSSPKTAPPPVAVARLDSKKKKKDSDTAEEEAPPAKRSRTEPSKKEATRASTRRSLELNGGRPSRRKSKVVSKLTALEVRVDVTPPAKQDETPKESKAEKKVAKSATPSEKKRKSRKAGGSSSSSGKKKMAAAAGADSGALAQAAAFKTSNPSTVIVMKKSNIAPCFYLNVPKDFARQHLPEDLKEFDMVDSTSKAWGVRWLGPPKRSFSGGWCYFAQDHDLQLNDVCVLELINEGRVKIHIFKADPKAKAAAAAAAAGGDPVANEGARGDGGGGGDGDGDGLRNLDAVVTSITDNAAPRGEEAMAEDEGDDEEEGDDEDYDPKEEEDADDDGRDDDGDDDDKET